MDWYIAAVWFCLLLNGNVVIVVIVSETYRHFRNKHRAEGWRDGWKARSEYEVGRKESK